MDIVDVSSAAEALRSAEADRVDRGRITGEWPELDQQAAYEVQDLVVGGRLDAGESLTGFKLGLTSKAKQEQMNVSAPLSAWVTDAHDVGAEIAVSEFIHPRIEPEIILVLNQGLSGPSCTADDVRAATTEVRAGFELIDSRYRDFSFALPDVIADNASAAGYVVGDFAAGPDTDLVAERVELLIDDRVVHSATGAAVYPDPFSAVADAVNALAARERSVPAGMLVLTGALTDAVFLEPGKTYTARFSTLGEVTVTAK